MKVPHNWIQTTIGELFDVQLGKMLNQKAKEVTPQYEYLGNKDVQWGTFNTSNLNTMHFNEIEKKKFSLKKGDILVCEGGEVGRCAVWEDTNKIIYYQKALHRLRTLKNNVIPYYFQTYLEFMIKNTNILNRFASKTSIAHLTRTMLLKFPVLLPPLAEQEKIAEILSTWDQAIESTEKLIANAELQKKALMQKLLTGKKRLLDENGKRFSGKWEKVKLGDVATMNSGGTPLSSIEEYYNGDILWVSIADMTEQGKYITDSTKKLTQLGIDNSSAKIFPKNTVLYAMYASIGECSIAKKEVSTSQAILGIQPKESSLDYIYLYFYLTCIKEKVKLQGQQGTQSNLNAAMVKAFNLHLPNLKEQQKIAEVLSTADREIELLTEKLEYLKAEKKALMQQLLTGKRRVKVA